MNAKQYIQHEKNWLSKVMHLMLDDNTISPLSPIERLKYQEFVERVLQSELEFLIESPEEYQDLYGGNELRIVN